MLRKQVFITEQMAKEIEDRAQQEQRSESAILRALLADGLSPSSMDIEMPSALPFAVSNLTKIGERQVALQQFILKSLLLTRNYTGRTLIEVLPDNSPETEIDELQETAESTYQDIIKELNR